ncbi:MAG: hypothetical protein HRT57_10525 [Crocinitomicaceae bacterium]|nr:hypothetical protein [Crocinitomicaceae bacterium]
MERQELSVANNMEEEVLQGLYNTPNKSRLGAINIAAQKPQIGELEAKNVQMGITDTVKKLEQENEEMFKEKENVADVVNVSEGEVSKKNEVVEVENKIMGMKPMVFGAVVILASVGAYFIYKNYKK